MILKKYSFCLLQKKGQKSADAMLEGCPESHLLTPRGLYDLNKEESVIQPIPK